MSSNHSHGGSNDSQGSNLIFPSANVHKTCAAVHSFSSDFCYSMYAVRTTHVAFSRQLLFFLNIHFSSIFCHTFTHQSVFLTSPDSSASVRDTVTGIGVVDFRGRKRIQLFSFHFPSMVVGVLSIEVRTEAGQEYIARWQLLALCEVPHFVSRPIGNPL